MMLIGQDYVDNNNSFTSVLKRNGPDVFVYAFASAGVAANTPCMIQHMGSGFNATALAASNRAIVGVPEGTQAVSAGSWGWFQIRGAVEDVQASAAEASGEAGHSVAWTAGVLYGSSSAYIGNVEIGQVGVFTAEANGSTSINIFLTGQWATPI
jgi:hypothetical protein